MAKLKCSSHQRRCVVTEKQILHKTGADPRVCDGRTAKIGDKLVSPDTIRSINAGVPQVVRD